jgi:hypothetical protein
MQTYEELAELARICARNARITTNKQVAAELWKMAGEYAHKAAKLDSGTLPDIGKPPPG